MWCKWGMPRKPRVEYAGAVYHVMSRGNHLQKIFRGDTDCGMFLETLGEACGRTGWRVHAYALMGNHYHLLLETPEPNLVVGSLCASVRNPAFPIHFSRKMSHVTANRIGGIELSHFSRWTVWVSKM